MNAAQVIAWLTCLVLAFFAAVLSVLNMGNVVRMEREMSEIRRDISAQGAGAQGASAPHPAEGFSSKEMSQVRDSLAKIRDEVHAAVGELGPDAPSDLREKLSALEEQIRKLEQALKAPPVP